MANLDTIYDIDSRAVAFEKHDRGVLVCLAGPGTGKSFSLLARSEALASRGCGRDAICYLTFIKEITRAFIDDYIQRFGVEAYATSAPRISTLHSFACRLIRNQGFRLKYDGELYFMNLADSDGAAKTLLGDLLPFLTHDGCRTIPQLRVVVEEIKRAWQDGIDPFSTPEPISLVVTDLIDFTRCFRLLDWDQSIPVAGELLGRLDPAPEWLSKIKHYFVDEYQDFNQAEQHLISQLGSTADSMVIVGDDDQSIYSGRGGSPEGLRTLCASEGNDRVTLVKCYRCKSTIVVPINAFQAHMSPTPRPMTAESIGGQVMCYRFKSSKAEVAFLAEYLRERLAELPEAPRPKDGIVCLFPSKRILGAYFEMLSPHVTCAKRDRDPPDSRVWLARVLSLLVRCRQRFLERLLLNSYTAIKPRHRGLIVRRVVERNISTGEACAALIQESAFAGAVLAEAQSFVDFCAHLAEQDLPPVGRAVSTKLALDETAVIAILEKLVDAEPKDRSELIEGSCDILLPDSFAHVTDPRAVIFLTIHGSKGLTRRTVVLPGMEEACLPNGGDPTEVAEKQRLFLVALSRATDNLLITLPRTRGGADRLNFKMPGRGAPSPFIAAAGLAVQYHD